MKDKEKQTIKQLAQELLEKLQIKAKISLKKDVNDIYQLAIETEEQGLLIGYHGNALNSFQIVLNSLVFKNLNKWVRIVVNVGDYREKREESLINLAHHYAQQALEGNMEIALPNLTPAERRIVHLALQENPQVTSESEGEGKYRKIVIKPVAVKTKQ